MSQTFVLPTQILGPERVLRQPSAYPTIEETETGGILVQAGLGTLNIVIDSPAYQGSHVPGSGQPGGTDHCPGTAEVGQVLTAKHRLCAALSGLCMEGTSREQQGPVANAAHGHQLRHARQAVVAVAPCTRFGGHRHRGGPGGA
jgi:hypothetical protein